MNKRTLFTIVLGAMVSLMWAAPIRWETDYAQALAEAQKTSKHLLLNFTGSDWCPWCFRLRDEVFATPEFQKYAEKNLICVELDFPRAKKQSDTLKKQNQELARQFGVPGFPTVLVLTPKGELAGTTGYRQGGGALYADHVKDIISGKAR
ncbi:MAG: thioredoxin family protein [Spirochaetes bacterium]|nr:thioredoxin family protein [Spirochaetota bacterium]